MAVFSDTITLYNHYTENGEDKWKKTVLEDCQWSPNRTMEMSTDGKLMVADYATVSVLFRDGYVAPDDFTGNGFTFQPKNLDIVALGKRTEMVTENNINELCARDDFLTIISVNDNTGRDRLKFWRLTAS
jgi:hypothetical protein